MTDAPEHLILKYLQGTLSPEEKEKFQSWLNETDDHRKMVSDFRTIWQVSAASETKIDMNEALEFERLQTSLAANEDANAPRQSKTKSYFLRIAAAIAVVFFSSFILYTLVFRNSSVTHETFSDIKEIDLPDGSKVWLNAKSSLKYTSDFSNERKISLEGEGFFEVQPDPEKPFVLHTGKAEISVLGTSFNVKAFQDDSLTEVFVVTGKVNFLSTELNKSIVLTPGLNGFLNKIDRTISLDAEPPLNITAWKDKTLVFRKAPLREVIKDLRNHFKVDIAVKNESLLDCRFTGTFNDARVEDIIAALSAALNLQVHHDSNRYLLDGTGCN
jgi:ferric-dicitrate binding protein FerR (iron transport regulator)